MPIDTSNNIVFVLTVILAIIAGIFVLALFISRLYVRASKETAFVRTGFGGQRVVMNGGVIVLPVLHEIIRVNMNTLRLGLSVVRTLPLSPRTASGLT